MHQKRGARDFQPRSNLGAPSGQVKPLVPIAATTSRVISRKSH
jgi:hypothetical protein